MQFIKIYVKFHNEPFDQYYQFYDFKYLDELVRIEHCSVFSCVSYNS